MSEKKSQFIKQAEMVEETRAGRSILLFYHEESAKGVSIHLQEGHLQDIENILFRLQAKILKIIHDREKDGAIQKGKEKEV